MKITVICTGNTCRSPMAEKIIAKRLPFAEVISRGIIARAGMPMSPNAIKVLQERGYSTDHTSRQFTSEDIGDVVLCMTEQHLHYCKPIKEKAVLLGRGIPDPFGGDYQVYVDTFDALERAIDEWMSSFLAMEA